MHRTFERGNFDARRIMDVRWLFEVTAGRWPVAHLYKTVARLFASFDHFVAFRVETLVERHSTWRYGWKSFHLLTSMERNAERSIRAIYFLPLFHMQSTNAWFPRVPVVSTCSWRIQSIICVSCLSRFFFPDMWLDVEVRFSAHEECWWLDPAATSCTETMEIEQPPCGSVIEMNVPDVTHEDSCSVIFRKKKGF